MAGSEYLGGNFVINSTSGSAESQAGICPIPKAGTEGRLYTVDGGVGDALRSASLPMRDGTEGIPYTPFSSVMRTLEFAVY